MEKGSGVGWVKKRGEGGEGGGGREGWERGKRCVQVTEEELQHLARIA